MIIQKLVNAENYEILEFFIKNGGEKEEEILNIILNIFDGCNDSFYDDNNNMEVYNMFHNCYRKNEMDIKKTNYKEKKIKF